MNVVCLAFAFSIPSLLFSTTLTADEYYIRYLSIGAAIALAAFHTAWFDCVSMNKPLKRKTKILFILLIAFIAYLAVHWATDAVSKADFIDGVFSLMVFLSVYLAARRKNSELWKILLAANLTGLLHVAFSYMQSTGLSHGIPWILPVERYNVSTMVGNIGYRGLLAIFVSVCVINTVYLALRFRSRSARFACVIMGLFFVAGLLAIEGRAAIIALVCASIPWAVSALMRVKLVAAHKRLVLFALIAATCASAYAARDSGIARRMLQIGTDVSSSLRLSHYATTLYMIREDPIFGVGFGNYKYRYLEAQITMKSDFPYGKQLPWTYTFWAHNEYLQFIAECGIPAFIIVLSLLFLWARQIYGFVRAVTKSLPEEFLWGLSIVILFAVSSFFERPFHQLEIGIWFPLGCAVMNACVSPDKPEPDESTRHKRESRKRNTSGGGWRGFLTALCITAFSLVGAALYIHGAIGQYALRQVRNELNNTNDVSALVRAYSSLVTAQKPLLTREEAQRVRSYLDVMYYAGMRNVNEAQNAVDRAFVYFLRHPTYETYIFVRKAATGLNRRDIMQRLADILPEQPVM